MSSHQDGLHHYGNPHRREPKWGPCARCFKALTKREAFANNERLANEELCTKCYRGTPAPAQTEGG